MSQIHEDPDLAVEIFVLKPVEAPPPADAEELPEVG
jgi:hypothetical protein